MKNKTVRDLTHIAIVAALYVVLTIVPPFNLISYGPYQFRIAEMFNLLGFYNRKYIIAVTLGCVIANFFSFNMIDVVISLTALRIKIFWVVSLIKLMFILPFISHSSW